MNSSFRCKHTHSVQQNHSIPNDHVRPYLAHHLSATAQEQQDVIHRQQNSWRHAQRQSGFLVCTIRLVPEHEQLSRLAITYT